MLPLNFPRLPLLVGQQNADPGSPWQFAFPMLALALLFYWMILRPQRQKEQQLKRMVENLKENDRVITIGGIHGVVTNVQRDQDRVTLRVDETTNAKIRVATSAIGRVLADDKAEQSTGVSKSK